MLDAAFARPPGDIGNASTWPFPVRFKVVPNATARRIVAGQDDNLLDAFVAAGEALVREGALGITTSCGFLAVRQRELAERLPVPVATSSLMQLPMIERCLPKGLRAGVVTYDADALTSRHFTEVGADPATPVAGLPPRGRFHGLIERNEAYDREALKAEVLDTVRRLREEHAAVGAIVLECTNLPPFSRDIASTFGLPVYDAITLGRWFYSGLLQSTYQPS